MKIDQGYYFGEIDYFNLEEDEEEEDRSALNDSMVSLKDRIKNYMPFIGK